MGDDRNKIGPLQFLDSRDVSFETVTRENADGANGEEQVVVWKGCKRGIKYLDNEKIGWQSKKSRLPATSNYKRKCPCCS